MQHVLTRVGNLFRFVNQLKNSARASKRALELGNDPGNFIEGFGVLICVVQENRQAAYTEAGGHS